MAFFEYLENPDISNFIICLSHVLNRIGVEDWFELSFLFHAHVSPKREIPIMVIVPAMPIKCLGWMFHAIGPIDFGEKHC